MATNITGDVLESYLQCKYKGYLKLAGEQGLQSDYELLLEEARNQVRDLRKLLGARHVGPPGVHAPIEAHPILPVREDLDDRPNRDSHHEQR